MFLKNKNKYQSGLSLVELLLVVSIIGILGIAAVMIINPTEILRQSRDGRRIADLQSIDRALGMYKQDNKVNFGGINIVYISLVDSTSSACASHSLPPLSSGWSYRCVTSESSLRRIDGTGWVPVDFTSITSGSIIPSLPVDPINSASGRFYYGYMTKAGRWALISFLESERYLRISASQDGGVDSNRLEVGTDISLWAQARGAN